MLNLNNWNKVQLKSFLLFILIGCITQSTFAQENSTKRADLNGKIIVPYKYDQIFKYNNNLSRVQTGGRWTGKYGFIDLKGNEIVKCKYEDADEFCEGLARVKINDKWGFIDTNGKEVIPPFYSFVKNFSEGLAGVTKEELYGFIDKKNSLIIDYKFDDIE